MCKILEIFIITIKRMYKPSERHAESKECWLIKFQLESIIKCKSGRMIELSANIHGLSANVASSWNSRLQHSGVSASLPLGMFVLVYLFVNGTSLFLFDDRLLTFLPLGIYFSTCFWVYYTWIQELEHTTFTSQRLSNVLKCRKKGWFYLQRRKTDNLRENRKIRTYFSSVCPQQSHLG